MGKLIILNGSPRAPKSNSRQYADIFRKNCKIDVDYFPISKTNHLDLCAKLDLYSDLLFVFPLYADGIPVTLLNFLKTLEKNPPKKKPTISMIINCGFTEPEQNNVAVQMIQIFCKLNGYSFGSTLKIGSGEAILETPFSFLVTSKMKKLSSSIIQKQYRTFQTTMPLPKKTFIRASTAYWINYGKKNGISKEQMETMKIE